jgi:hypothetical protein
MTMLDTPPPASMSMPGSQPGMSPGNAPGMMDTGMLSGGPSTKAKKMTPAEVRGALMAENKAETAYLKTQQKIATVNALFYRARDAKRNMVAQWRSSYKILNNKTWTMKAEPWMPTPEVSNIWPLLASMTAWMTDQRPSFETTPSMVPFSPQWQHADKIAEHMNATLSSSFSVNNLDAEIERVLWDVGTYGIGYTKCTWEPWLADGLGDSAFRRVDPFTIYPDPYARTMEQANYIIEAKIMTVDDVDRAWPGAMKTISTRRYEDVDQAPHRTDDLLNNVGPRVRYSALADGSGGYGSTRFTPSARSTEALVTDDPVVLVIECWTRTHEIDTEGMENGTARVTDRWKCTVVCGDTILMDKYADEIYGFNTHPYDKMVMFDTGEWYGASLVQFLASPQQSINRLLAQIEHNIMLLGNPILLQAARAGVRQTTMSNRPGGRMTGSPNDTSWLAPPQLHPDTFQLLQYLETKMESIAGLAAIMRGVMPGGRNAQGTIDTVQDGAFVRVRAILRNLERMLKSVCNKMAANNAEFYTEPRIVMLSGEGGKDTALALKSMHFYMDYKPGDITKEAQPVPVRFMVRADAGSERPTSRGARAAEADTLFAMQAIDEIEVLEAHAWPNAGEVAGRVMDNKAAQGTLGQPPSRRAAAGRTS